MTWARLETPRIPDEPLTDERGVSLPRWPENQGQWRISMGVEDAEELRTTEPDETRG